MHAHRNRYWWNSYDCRFLERKTKRNEKSVSVEYYHKSVTEMRNAHFTILRYSAEYKGKHGAKKLQSRI